MHYNRWMYIPANYCLDFGVSQARCRRSHRAAVLDVLEDFIIPFGPPDPDTLRGEKQKKIKLKLTTAITPCACDTSRFQPNPLRSASRSRVPEARRSELRITLIGTVIGKQAATMSW